MTPTIPPSPLGGLLAPWHGLRHLASQRGLWAYAVLPFLINLGLLSLFFWFSYTRFDQWVRGMLPSGEGWWWALLLYLLITLLVLLLLLVEVYVFTLVGSVVAAPFLELLTRKVEQLAHVAGAPDWADTSLWQDVLRALRQSLKRLGLYLLIMLPLWLLNLLPLLGQVLYVAISFLVTCFFLTLSFLDYPLDRRGLSLAAKLKYVRSLGWDWLGFGAAVFGLGILPVLNLLLLPAAAVGGTLLFMARPLAARPSAPPPPPQPRP